MRSSLLVGESAVSLIAGCCDVLRPFPARTTASLSGELPWFRMRIDIPIAALSPSSSALLVQGSPLGCEAGFCVSPFL